MATPEIPDAAARDAAIRERARNVLVDAGAGTGKTTLIVARVVDMVAPADPRVEPVRLERLAVVTFTRRAAGELRYRLRQRLLAALRDAPAEPRAERLRRALGVVDTAYVGTIHSFADRLLRRFPAEARLSPGYEIAEETDELVREVYDRLVHAAQNGRLAEALGDRDPGRVPLAEVEETVRTVQASGLRMETREHAHGEWVGLDRLVEGMIGTRDVPWVPGAWTPDVDRLRATARRWAAALAGAPAASRGGRWLRAAAARLGEAAKAPSLPELFRAVHEVLRRFPVYQKARDFDGDRDGWNAYKSFRDGRGDLVDPLHRWMGTRIARVREAVVALYERVKEERGVVDQLDLLLKLRDLLRRHPEARRSLQTLFAHVFVDEFQDTDPLQCEVVFFLCEDGAAARDWREVRLRPGSVTVVGDPKQSIYRFRRADVLMYAEAHRMLRAQGALTVRLVTSFRSRPRLLALVNRQFGRLFGEVSGDERFDPATGRVRYEALAADPRAADPGPAVEVLPYAGAGGAPLTADGRAIEAEVLARRIRHVVATRRPVRDPETRVERPARYGDVAVLAHVTLNVGLLLSAFERLGIRYSAHGGTLFLSDPLVRRYLLALRAIADPSDGVAEAALLRPPFFALDLLDLVSARLDGEADAAARARLDDARALVRELRRDRARRPPIETAVDLIERTALGRAAATGPNGKQALETLYHVAYELGRRAAAERLDYDGASRRLRDWVTHPVKLDPPEALDPDAVRVLTIHQAKGLEFPVVALWDGFAEKQSRVAVTWKVARTANGIALALEGLETELPPGSGLLAAEKAQAAHERERLYYVAMTRARDLLIVTEPRLQRDGDKILPVVLNEVDPGHVERVEEYRPDAVPAWAAGDAPPAGLVGDAAIARAIARAQAAFAAAAPAALRGIAVPVKVTRLAQETPAPEADDEAADVAGERAAKAEGSRFGRTFGTVVHRAIELGLGGAAGDARDWVRRAAREHGLAERLDDAADDVQRGLAAVRALAGGRPVLSEVPVVLPLDGGRMGVGVIDAVVAGDGETLVLDFKSDAPSETVPPNYRRQLEAYVAALRAAVGEVGTVRPGLVFTATGAVAWVDSRTSPPRRA
jgi:ATP-dependent helicase/nuclease subunit A